MPRPIEERADFGIVRYANCWEDAALLLDGFANLRGQRFVSIASAGDNTLALLLLDPAEVIAVDLSGAQLACLALRIAAFRELGYDALLAFLGVHPANAATRAAAYARVRDALDPGSRAFWDARPHEIRHGVIHAGRFERYFRKFRRYLLPLVQSRRKRRRLLSFNEAAAQAAFYDRRWNNRRWRWLFRLFFSRRVMGRSGRDPEFFRYVEGSVADRILARAELCLRHLPGAENPWLQYIVGGNFLGALPPYLEANHYPQIRARLDRIRLVHGPLEQAVPGDRVAVTGWNLSDIFEYMDPALFRSVVDGILARSAPGSRLACWNMLVPRMPSREFPGRLARLDGASEAAFAADRAFFYSAFHLEEVR